MNDFAHWLPTISTAAVVVGVAFVADAAIKRHEKVLEELREDVQSLKTEVAVLKATAKGVSNG